MEDTIVRVIGGPDDYSLRICIYLQRLSKKVSIEDHIFV